MSIYTEAKAKGLDIGSHQSDLYLPFCKESARILNGYPVARANTTTFVERDSGRRWFSIPFAFDPYWEKRGCRKAFKKGETCLVDDVRHIKG